MHGIPESWGTACNVQAMVFGNLGEDSATGVAFIARSRRRASDRSSASGCPTRRARTWWPASARRCPFAARVGEPKAPRSKRRCPRLYAELVGIARPARKALPRHAGSRVHDPARAALTCCSAAPASAPRGGGSHGRGDGQGGAHLARTKRFSASMPRRSISCCTPRSIRAPRRRCSRAGSRRAPARRSGQVVFSAEEAERRAGQGKAVILVRVETSPEDMDGMKAARGDSHRARRHDQPRRGRGARHGQMLRGGVLRGERQLPRASDDGQRLRRRGSQERAAPCQSRRRHHARWRDRQRLSGRGSTAPASLSAEFAELMQWADEVAHAQGARERGHAARRPHRAQLRRRGRRASAGPSTCSSTTSGSPPCGK